MGEAHDCARNVARSVGNASSNGSECCWRRARYRIGATSGYDYGLTRTNFAILWTASAHRVRSCRNFDRIDTAGTLTAPLTATIRIAQVNESVIDASNRYGNSARIPHRKINGCRDVSG